MRRLLERFAQALKDASTNPGTYVQKPTSLHVVISCKYLNHMPVVVSLNSPLLLNLEDIVNDLHVLQPDPAKPLAVNIYISPRLADYKIVL